VTEIAGVAAGAVRVLGPQIPRAEEIETIPAAFEMDEILYELREHASGLNAGRWDYLFSVIKYFRDAGPDFVLPDRGSVRSGRPATGSTGPGSPTRTWSRSARRSSTGCSAIDPTSSIGGATTCR